MNKPDCPFCNPDTVLAETRLFRVLRDRYPVNPGHTLVVLKRHEPSALRLNADEWADLRDALDAAVAAVESEFGACEFNIGVNIGESAGQTVPHVHIHVIPRFPGDCEDPRGGVRRVKPALVEY